MKPSLKILTLSGLGGCLEFYDFVIFALFAPAISQAFFPAGNTLISLIQTFGVFAIGYLIRPLGGVVFGHWGDRHGRKGVFAVTVLIMGISTFLMGLMPSYAQWGLTATVLFSVLRLLQGFSLGGEISGGLVFIGEHLSKRPGFACGFLFFCINMGIILGQVLNWILAYAGIAPDIAWRVAFIIGGGLALVSYCIRKNLSETPAFDSLLTHRITHRLPLGQILKHHRRFSIICFFLVSAGACLVTLSYLFMVSYLHSILHYPLSQTILVTLIGVAIFSSGALFFAFISDIYLGRPTILLVGAVLWLLLALPFYRALLGHTSHLLPWFILISLVNALITGAFPSLIVELFPTNVRYSGVALSYNLGYAIFAGLTPVCVTLLIHYTGDLSSPAWWLMATMVLVLLALFLLRGRYRPGVSTFLETG